MGRFVFGDRSLNNLSQTHPKMQELARKALEVSEQDFTIICGYRSKAEQEDCFARGTTKVHYPNSAHNQTDSAGKPRSCAIDVMPYPFTNWNDPAMLDGWRKINEAFVKASKETGIPFRWGGDFNRDGNKTTSDSWDKPHYELHPWREWGAK